MAEMTANKKQLECIENTEGKYLVLAGPGTGKTFTVTTRIKYMIEEKQIDPKTILCLTFTDTAANEMRKKLEEKIGEKALEVNIYTYHGFCNELIGQYNDEFEIKENVSVLTNPAIVRALIKECIEELNPQAFRTEKNNPYLFINNIKNGIEEIKKHRLTKEAYFKNIENNPDWVKEKDSIKKKLEEKHAKNDTRTITDEKDLKDIEKKIEKAKELWKFYELYSEKMWKKHYIDFNDMIALVLEKFEESPTFLKKILYYIANHMYVVFI